MCVNRELQQLRRQPQRRLQKNNRFYDNKKIALQVHHAFLYISLTSTTPLRLKPPNWTFHEGRGHTKTNFPSSFWTWIKSLRIQPREKSNAFDILSGSKQTRLSLKEPKFIFLPTFSLPLSSSLLKVPNKLRSGGRFSTKFCRLFWVACKLRCFQLLTMTLFLRQNKLFV